MPRALLRTLHALLLTVLLTALSAVSAHEMAPDREALERHATLQVYGGTLADFCGLHDDHDVHRCPFCHKLPGAPRVVAPDLAQPLVLPILHLGGAHLVLSPQTLRPYAAPRAPPALI